MSGIVEFRIRRRDKKASEEQEKKEAMVKARRLVRHLSERNDTYHVVPVGMDHDLPPTRKGH